MRNWGSAVLCLAVLTYWTNRADAQCDTTNSDPTCVAGGSASSTFKATVVCDYDFNMNLKVYKNGVLKYNHTTYVVNDGPVYYYSEVVTHIRILPVTRDVLRYVGRATIAEGPWNGFSDEDSHQVTVTDT